MGSPGCAAISLDILISLHIRSMWETICDAQAGFWLNSKFLSKFSRKPLSGISDQKAPLPPPNEKLQIWDDQSLLWNTPPKTPKWKTWDLRWPKFTLEYPTPPPQNPKMKNFRFEMTKVYSRIPHPPKPQNEKLQIWDDKSVLWNTPPPKPQNEKLQIWDDKSLLWNTPTKPWNEKLQIWDDQSLLRNTPPKTPKWKTSDLRWPKFTPEYPPKWKTSDLRSSKNPKMKNFRFEMTKVYSGIPPSKFKTSDLRWPKFTLEYPPPHP